MNNKAILNEGFVYLGLGIVFLTIVALCFTIFNPKIEAQCIAKGGQVLAHPGDFSSCLYPTK